MTIRSRVRVGLFLMMLVPVLLMIGAFAVARRFNPDAAGPGQYGHFGLLNARVRSFIVEFNTLVNDNPRGLSDPRTLASLDQAFGRESFGGWIILRDGQELYRSSGISTDPRSGWGWRWRSRGRLGSAPDFTWSFPFGDGRTGTLKLYVGMPWMSPFRGPGFFIAFLAIVIGCNGLLGWWISSAVIAPLAGLRSAANRIGDGDLDFRLPPSRPDEFGEVTAAFETMRQKLQAAVTRQLAEQASRKELIAHVSHDLRTPINLVRGYAEGLRDGVASTPQMRERYLDTILERSEELERLIELLFAYSTMDLEGVRPKLAAVRVGPYLHALRDALSTAFPAAAISLVLPEAPTDSARQARDLRIMADAELTRRVMSNLVDNAVKHGGKTPVTVQWRVARAASSPRAPAVVNVVVSDDGAGVAPEDLPRIFEPFFRADRARPGSGAGLGLSIVRKIMEAQGGSVSAAAGPEGGLEVTLSFPEAKSDVEADPDR